MPAPLPPLASITVTAAPPAPPEAAPASPDAKAAPPNALRTAFVLHGVLGSARNWLSFTRRLAPRLPGWRFVLVDLRNHGDSHGLPPPQTLAACADDVAALAAHLQVQPEAVIGHSFGGKVALAYASRPGQGGLRQCWVLDAVPGRTERGPVDDTDPHEVVAVVAALRTLPLPIVSRGALQEALRARGFSESFTGWMTTNLRPLDTGGFTWRFALESIDAMLESYFETDFWPFLSNTPAGLTVRLVRAERSDRWRAADLARLEQVQGSGRVRLSVLANAGHWLHVDNPEGLMDLLVDGLAAPATQAGAGASLLSTGDA